MKPNEIKILVVDDEPDMLELIQYLFKKFNFTIEIANSGNEAWQILKDENDINLVLTDVRMPDGDGVDLAKKIREKNPIKPSILFMSGFSDLLNEEIYHIGAEGKFTKPFDNNAVRLAIETCMLVPYLRWKTKPFQDPRRIHIDLKSESLQQLEGEKKVGFGRGGFFIAYDKSPPEKNGIISFEITVNQPEAIVFAGNGIVKWTHPRSSSGIPAGVGLEILYLPESQAAMYHSLFGQVASYIPSPYRKS